MDNWADKVDVEDGPNVDEVKYDGHREEAKPTQARHCEGVNDGQLTEKCETIRSSQACRMSIFIPINVVSMFRVHLNLFLFFGNSTRDFRLTLPVLAHIQRWPLSAARIPKVRNEYLTLYDLRHYFTSTVI